jgi:23S rRNA (guanosine2251-2'-O)-methyltransferase
MRKLSTDELNRLSPQEALQLPRLSLSLVLDNVRSGLNVGSAFRTADAFGLAHLYLCGISAQPPHREILKTALGATEAVPWSYHASTAELVGQLKAEGFRVVAVEQAAGSMPLQLFSRPPGQPLALIFGNEVNGVSEEVMALVDEAIEIPQVGSKHSLNISVCVGVVSWHFFQQQIQGGA